MSERALEIADELAKVISTRDDLGDVVEALFDCLAFGLGQLCPECRRSMAAAIAAQLLPAAEKCAADSPDEDEEPLYEFVSAPALALNEWPHTMPNVIPFPDTRQAEVASERLRTITIELLALIYDAHGRAGFERCAEELIEAVDAVLEHERAKVRDF